METNKILSFEEFSTRGTDTATAEAPTVDTATVDTTPDAETTTDTTTDTETTDSEETTTDTETTDSEETTDTEETEEETTDTEETEEETVATESVQINEEEEEHKATVAEMYEKACSLLKEEAMAYESDDYEEHTKDTYMIETANLCAEGHCNAVKEMYEETNCTLEQYEAACNKLKEAYEKKCNEMIEAYGANETQETEPTQAPDAAIVTKNEQ